MHAIDFIRLLVLRYLFDDDIAPVDEDVARWCDDNFFDDDGALRLESLCDVARRTSTLLLFKKHALFVSVARASERDSPAAKATMKAIAANTLDPGSLPDDDDDEDDDDDDDDARVRAEHALREADADALRRVVLAFVSAVLCCCLFV